MSIASEITRISQNVSDSLDAVAAKGVTVPTGSNSDDLPDLIAAIPTGSGSAITITDTTDSHGGIVRTITGVSLAGDTVTAAHLESGYTAHDSLGNPITGTLSPGGGTNLQAKTNISPTESSQTITADSGYDGLSSVQINAVSSTYVGTGITRRSSSSLSASGAEITAPAGYYENDAEYTTPDAEIGYSSMSYSGRSGTVTVDLNVESAGYISSGHCTIDSFTGDMNALDDTVHITPSTSQQIAADYGTFAYRGQIIVDAMPSGTAGTPTATKGTVSNHSVSVTPSVTNTTGYITGSTKTGTAVTVSASELVSGNKEINQNGTNIDVANYSTVSVAVPASEPNLQAKTNISPTTSSQTITADNGYDGLSSVQINAMPTMTLPTSAAASATSGYSSKATISRSTSDQYINIPTGYNSAGAYYKVNAVANGSVTAPSTISGTSATVSTGTNTLTLTKAVSVTPSVTTAGYISSGTAGNSSVSLTASVTTQAAQTIHPSTTDQSIAASRYLTGAQTIKAVTHNLDASKILSGTTFKIGDSSDDDCVASVAGTVTFQTIYSGSSAPSSSTGVNGDVYIQTA